MDRCEQEHEREKSEEVSVSHPARISLRLSFPPFLSNFKLTPKPDSINPRRHQPHCYHRPPCSSLLDEHACSGGRPKYIMRCPAPIGHCTSLHETPPLRPPDLENDEVVHEGDDEAAEEVGGEGPAEGKGGGEVVDGDEGEGEEEEAEEETKRDLIRLGRHELKERFGGWREGRKKGRRASF